jgi:hypothetical protein
LDKKLKRVAINYFNSSLFLLRWPDGNWEIDRHMAPLGAYIPPDEREVRPAGASEFVQLKTPTPEVLAGFPDNEKIQFMAAWARVKGNSLFADSRLVTETPAKV